MADGSRCQIGSAIANGPIARCNRCIACVCIACVCLACCSCQRLQCCKATCPSDFTPYRISVDRWIQMPSWRRNRHWHHCFVQSMHRISLLRMLCRSKLQCCKAACHSDCNSYRISIGKWVQIPSWRTLLGAVDASHASASHAKTPASQDDVPLGL